MTDLFDEDGWVGASVVPELIGRAEMLAEIPRLISKGGDQGQVIFLFGEGGIGKTRLLQKLVQQLQSTKKLLVARELIDLYDLDTHSPVVLVAKLFEVLTPPEEPFREYLRRQRELERSEATGALTETGDLRQKMLDAFISNLAALAHQRRVVIMLDTAERLVYSSDQPDSANEIAESWQWLAEQLPKLHNVTMLVAGRKQMRALMPQPQAKLQLHEREIPALSPDEAHQYFNALAKALAVRDPRTAHVLQSLPDQFRQQAHTAAAGRPILLALLADLLTVRGLDVAQTVFDQQHHELHRLDLSIESIISNRLMETPHLGNALRAVGRLRKGADVPLTLAVMQSKQEGITSQQVHKLLDSLARLSFVKPRSGRIFLHDVMYEMLDAHVYNTPDDPNEAATALDAVLEHYRGLQEQLQRDTDEAYAPVEQMRRTELLSVERLRELTLRRRALLPEVVYYHLKRDSVRGFRYYVRYTFDAILSGDITLDVQLEAEILAFLKEHDMQGVRPSASQLERAVVEGVALIRPLARAFAANQQAEAQQYANDLRQNEQRLQIGGPATQALLNIWQAASLTRVGTEVAVAEARELLDQAIQILREIINQRTASPATYWRAQVGLAYGYQIRGYLRWSRGMLSEAISDYSQAVALGREVRVLVNLATALNDLGFVRAELGELNDARALVEDALKLRRARGPRVPVAYSLNTLALIDIREGSYRAAIEQAEQALIIFRALEHKRGTVLALIALAEAKRRYAGTEAVATEEKVKQLYDAREYAREALELAEDIGEKLRQIEALIEIGCATRDWVRVRTAHPNAIDNLQRLGTQSRNAFNQAADLAEDTSLYRKIDALVNMAFLSYYRGRTEETLAAVKQAQQAFPDGYQLETATGRPVIERRDAMVQIWTQLGKLHTLLGHQAFDRYLQSGTLTDRQVLLTEAVENYLLSLQYNSLYSPDHFGMRKVRDQIYERLKNTRSDELRQVVEQVQLIEERYHIRESGLKRLLQNRALWYES